MRNASLHQHWVCFDCRKQFRQSVSLEGLPSRRQAVDVKESIPCAICKAPMVNMGNYFCPPRRNDRRAWEQMRLLAKEGVRFYTEGAKYWWHCEGVTQKSLRDTQKRLQRLNAEPQTQGEALLQRIAQKRGRAKKRPH